MPSREIVQDGDGMALLQQELSRGAAYVAGAASNQDIHSHGEIVLLSRDRASGKDSTSILHDYGQCALILANSVTLGMPHPSTPVVRQTRIGISYPLRVRKRTWPEQAFCCGSCERKSTYEASGLEVSEGKKMDFSMTDTANGHKIFFHIPSQLAAT